MDECFNIPDLVFEICSYCQRPELAILGRTARLFDCALDVLWKDMTGEHGLIELFKCLSEEVIKLSFPRQTWGGFLASSSVHLRRDIEERHWERFTFYTKRVRTLHIHSLLVHPNLVDAINTWAPLEGVCPNLRQLSIPAGINKPSFLEIFLCADLEKLSLNLGHVYTHDSRARLLDSLSSLPTRCPVLAALDLDCNPFNHSLVPFLAQFVNLRDLSLDGLDPSHFPISPSFSKLTKLYIKFRGELQPPIDSDVTPAFACLEWLKIPGTPDQILAVLRHISQSPLQSLSLSIRQEPEVEFDSVISGVANRCRRATLRQIFVEAEPPQWCLPPSIADITSDWLYHLFVFPNMEQFECRIYDWLYPTDGVITTLAKSWPKLVSFRIERFRRPFGPWERPFLTINCLRVLATHCLQLAHLSIEFDAVVDEDFETEATIVTCAYATGNPVQTLHVGWSTIDAAPPVAAYLANIFPQLKDISIADDPSYDPLNEVMKEKWAQVREILSGRA